MKTKVNLKSVLISGISAGFTILIVGGGLVPIMGDNMDKALEQLSVPPLSNGAMIYFAIASLILGMALMAVYAFILDKFKSKYRAVVSVATFFWLFTFVWSNASLLAYGFLPFKIVALGTLWGLLELFSAVLVGSKIYKESE